MTIQQATPSQAADIARLIMAAMTDDCCQFLAGPNHTLADFHRMMTALVALPHTQYSYANTLAATDADGRIMGICVSYDGAQLHTLREAFIAAARQHLQMDYSHMDDETHAGEVYIDSLAVSEPFRRHGVATALLRQAIARAHAKGLPAGLLVDKGNPNAERLYRSLGFAYVGDAIWGGHPMSHLQCHPQSTTRDGIQ